MEVGGGLVCLRKIFNRIDHSGVNFMKGSLVCRELCSLKLYPKIANYMEIMRKQIFTFAEKSSIP